MKLALPFHHEGSEHYWSSCGSSVPFRAVLVVSCRRHPLHLVLHHFLPTFNFHMPSFFLLPSFSQVCPSAFKHLFCVVDSFVSLLACSSLHHLLFHEEQSSSSRFSDDLHQYCPLRFCDRLFYSFLVRGGQMQPRSDGSCIATCLGAYTLYPISKCGRMS